MDIHVTGSTRGATRYLDISISGCELDIINLIDDLDLEAGDVMSEPQASRLRSLRKAITNTVGLVRDAPATREPTYGWRTDERA